MDIAWSDLGVALGIALMLEGILYALFPAKMRDLMSQILAMDDPDRTLRIAGLTFAAVGLAIVWWVRG